MSRYVALCATHWSAPLHSSGEKMRLLYESRYGLPAQIEQVEGLAKALPTGVITVKTRNTVLTLQFLSQLNVKFGQPVIETIFEFAEGLFGWGIRLIAHDIPPLLRMLVDPTEGL